MDVSYNKFYFTCYLIWLEVEPRHKDKVATLWIMTVLFAGLVCEILIEKLLINFYVELIGLEENDEPDNVENDEEEVAEANNSDEEWDA